MSILLIAEHDNYNLSDQTAKTLSAAKQIGKNIHVLIAGKDCSQVISQAAKLNNITKVLVAESDILANHLAEPMANLIFRLASEYEVLIAPATVSGKNIMPRVAALLDVMQISEITAVKSENIFQRRIYAGSAIQTLQSNEFKKVITVQTASFPSAEYDGEADIEILTDIVDPELSVFEHNISSKKDRPELTSARIVVSGGRALGSQDNFNKIIIAFADKLRAAVGASRSAVEAGFAPNDWQVGQTGKTVAPELYIACGISGAIQHVAGIKDSNIIVAINKDQEAPIFQIADYGLVADLFEVIPELIEYLQD